MAKKHIFIDPVSIKTPFSEVKRYIFSLKNIFWSQNNDAACFFLFLLYFVMYVEKLSFWFLQERQLEEKLADRHSFFQQCKVYAKLRFCLTTHYVYFIPFQISTGKE